MSTKASCVQAERNCTSAVVSDETTQETQMRHVLVPLAALVLIGTAHAQTPLNSPPAAIGNRANGLSYQPTPSQVAPRERAAGVGPSAQQLQKENNDLSRLDAQSLKAEGLNPKSAPPPNGR